MKTYTVKEIADMLSVDPETVRRWIRDKKLKAEQSSRKEGSKVTEEDLYKYLSSTAKYAGTAAIMASESPALAVLPLIGAGATGIMSAALAIVLNEKKKNPELSEDSVKALLVGGIKDCQQKIEQKLKARKQLDDEIINLREQIEAYKAVLEKISTNTNDNPQDNKDFKKGKD